VTPPRFPHIVFVQRSVGGSQLPISLHLLVPAFLLNVAFASLCCCVAYLQASDHSADPHIITPTSPSCPIPTFLYHNTHIAHHASRPLLNGLISFTLAGSKVAAFAPATTAAFWVSGLVNIERGYVYNCMSDRIM
jgi:hypothetical protein